jgi:hypothetical protein
MFLSQLRTASVVGVVLLLVLASVLYLAWSAALHLAQRRRRRASNDPVKVASRRSRLLRVLAGMVVFAYFVWPTPWVYGVFGGSEYRGNWLTDEGQIFSGGRWRDVGNCSGTPLALRRRFISDWLTALRPGP